MVVVLLAGAFAAAGRSAEARAGQWMYRRSDYSHAPYAGEARTALPRPHSRSAYRPAIVGGGPGFAVRGGFRRNRILLRSGRSSDITIIYENWHNLRAWP